MLSTPRLVVAASHSGSGKSTIAGGLMAALAQMHSVQGFKVGPDYIDPGYHTLAAGRISRNLDTWMTPHDEVLRLFARAAHDADIAVIEGVMGLFDGVDGRSEAGSTAEVAKLLDAPVVLVIDVSKMARSAGAIALGCRMFDPRLRLMGVICNNVASANHALWVTQAIESVGLPVLGCVPRMPALKTPERHLGLHTATERVEAATAFLHSAAEAVRQHVNLDQVWQIACTASKLTIPAEPVPEAPVGRVRIAVARDAAFCFYYEDNFDYLRAAGAEPIFFSPLHDTALPEGVHGLYLGGGYPELYAARLAANQSMMRSLRSAIDAGLPTYAECGGLMVLTESITDLEGKTHPMLGVAPGRAVMVGRLTLGYREVMAVRNSLLLQAGESVRGHEFHYSDWVERPNDLPAAYEIRPRNAEATRLEGFAQGNVLASYVHLHFSAMPKMAQRFVQACVEYAARV
ncbi:MAG: cobyrinate a,c-diamide synthase [Caldilinea sp.]|nr:cobyrinate a,c-diamide synthase [Caldilinea sp.]MDW8440504.1 cobyrinate a,c-diamide synthase [Caldilineaceae bacterium]